MQMYDVRRVPLVSIPELVLGKRLDVQSRALTGRVSRVNGTLIGIVGLPITVVVALVIIWLGEKPLLLFFLIAVPILRLVLLTLATIRMELFKVPLACFEVRTAAFT